MPIIGWQGRAGITHRGAYRRTNLALSGQLCGPTHTLRTSVTTSALPAAAALSRGANRLPDALRGPNLGGQTQKWKAPM